MSEETEAIGMIDNSVIQSTKPVAKVNFVLYRGTLEMIEKFQLDYPDVDIHEASSYINQAIISMIKDYRQWHHR